MSLNLKGTVSSLVGAVRALRSEYDEHGPGRVDESFYQKVDAAFQFLAEVIRNKNAELEDREVLAAAQTCKDLCYRCVTDPAGLCFVTGEAGLVPRKDLLDAFTNALQFLEEFAA